MKGAKGHAVIVLSEVRNNLSGSDRPRYVSMPVLLSFVLWPISAVQSRRLHIHII